MIRRITRGDLASTFGFQVRIGESLAVSCLDDTHGGVLDGVCSRVPAAWGPANREGRWGARSGCEHEGWIPDPALVRESQNDSSWEPIADRGALPKPPKGAFNSSATRVRPVFETLHKG